MGHHADALLALPLHNTASLAAQAVKLGPTHSDMCAACSMPPTSPPPPHVFPPPPSPNAPTAPPAPVPCNAPGANISIWCACLRHIIDLLQQSRLPYSCVLPCAACRHTLHCGPCTCGVSELRHVASHTASTQVKCRCRRHHSDHMACMQVCVRWSLPHWSRSRLRWSAAAGRLFGHAHCRLPHVRGRPQLWGDAGRQVTLVSAALSSCLGHEVRGRLSRCVWHIAQLPARQTTTWPWQA